MQRGKPSQAFPTRPIPSRSGVGSPDRSDIPQNFRFPQHSLRRVAMTFGTFSIVLGMLAAIGAGADDLGDLSGLAGAPLKIREGNPERVPAEILDRLKDSLTLEAAIGIAAG